MLLEYLYSSPADQFTAINVSIDAKNPLSSFPFVWSSAPYQCTIKLSVVAFKTIDSSVIATESSKR